ncbi:MAG: hypothetical protein Q8M91_17710 [Polaromonas sp.]|nr:hypothetical protein [Polaromonas sp.]
MTGASADKKTCFYSQPTCSGSLTREHVVSATVLKAVYGDPIRNSAYLDGWSNALIDHEQVVKDVCSNCNNNYLSRYDVAGKALIDQLLPISDPTRLRIKVDRDTFGWIVKTHLNGLRIIKDVQSNHFYPIASSVKTALVSNSPLPLTQLRIFVCGIAGKKEFWEAGHPEMKTWLKISSMRFVAQRISLSQVLLKNLLTVLVLPCDADPENFLARSNSAMYEFLTSFGVFFQELNILEVEASGFFDLTKMLTTEEMYTYTNRYYAAGGR